MSETSDGGVVRVLGVPLHPLTLVGAAEIIIDHVDRRAAAYVCVRDVHGVILCRTDHDLVEIHERAALVTTDGVPLMRAVRRAGYPIAERVYGPDLMLEVLGRRVGALRHFLYGSTPEVLASLRRRLAERIPGVAVVGAHSPPFRPLSSQEVTEERELIRSAHPDVVWVGLSTPKQERWMSANVGRVGDGVLIGVGAAFDFLAGHKAQAPGWMRSAGLEWAFRLMTEPRRLVPRYLRVVPSYLWLRTLERLGQRKSA